MKSYTRQDSSPGQAARHEELHQARQQQKKTKKKKKKKKKKNLLGLFCHNTMVIYILVVEETLSMRSTITGFTKYDSKQYADN